MGNIERLNNIDHADLRVVVEYCASLGDGVNQALVFPTEFAELQREYPILFQKNADGELQSVALLGLEKDENLFLDGSGWNARYVPAMHQRGPFLIGFEDKDAGGLPVREPVIHIDLHHQRISREEGFPIFLQHGGNAPLLDAILKLLHRIHNGAEMSPTMFDHFEAAGLLEPITLEFTVNEADKYQIAGYYSISEERLALLDGPTLAKLNQSGFLALAFAIISSLGNFRRLIDLKRRKHLDGEDDGGA